MLDFISIGLTELQGTGSNRQIQNENICLQRDTNPQPITLTIGALHHLATLTAVFKRLTHYII